MGIVSGSVIVTDPAAPPTRVVAPSSGAVAAGDYFVIQWLGEGNFFNRPTAQAGAFLRITPVL